MCVCVCKDTSAACCIRHAAAAQPMHLQLSWLWLPSKDTEITAKDVTSNGTENCGPQIDGPF